jgi:hypothetical protein
VVQGTARGGPYGHRRGRAGWVTERIPPVKARHGRPQALAANATNDA